MSYEFLAPDAAAGFNGSRPAARSPIEWVHRRAGASFEERDGWRIVADYGAAAAEAAACRGSVGIADLSHLGKLDLQGEPKVVASIVGELAGGAALEQGQAELHDRVWWCPMSTSRVITISPPEVTARLREEIEAVADGSFAFVNELTTGFGSNAVVGPLARETFARTTALDLRSERFGERAFAPVSVARTPGMILREGGDRFVHLFGAGFADYVWTVFLDAAESLGGSAVGSSALDATSGAE